MTNKDKSSGSVGRKFVGGVWTEYAITHKQGTSKYQAKRVTHVMNRDETTVFTIYANGTGVEIAQTLPRYGGEITSRESNAEGSEIVFQCYNDAVDSTEEYLDGNEDVRDYSVARTKE